MKKNVLFFQLIVLFLFNQADARQKGVGRLLPDSSDSLKKGSFIVVPAIGYAQEKGWEFGLVSLSSFYSNRRDTTTRSSTITGVAAITTKKQAVFGLKPDIWTTGNAYHYGGEIKYKNFPFNFYGVGDRTRAVEKDVIIQKMFRISVEGEKKIRNGLYTGLNIGYENYSFRDKEAGGIFETSTDIRGKAGGQAVFLGASQILDSRNTNTYTTAGTYIRLNYSFIPALFAGENFSGSVFKLDFRTFKSYRRKTTLGIQLNYQTLQGSNSPFYLMPQLGNDQIMRGYYSGRYRNDNLLAAQAELRYRFIPRLGMAAFGGAGSVYSNNYFRWENFKPSYGAGLRYFVNPERGLSLRLDYAFGERRPGEERQKGFYLAFAEAF